MRIFIFAALGNEEENESSGKLFEITSNGLEIVKDSNKKNFRGDICLMYEPPQNINKPKLKYINTEIFDINLADSEIRRLAFTKFNSYVETKIFSFKTNENIFKLAITIEKETLKKLFIQYEFAKIIPLNIFLLEMGKGVNGILSSNIGFFKSMTRDYKSAKTIEEIQYILNEHEYISTMDKTEIELLVNLYHSNSLDEDINSNLFNLIPLDNKVLQKNLFSANSYTIIKKSIFIKKIKETQYFIEDTVSNYYKSKLFKPFLIVIILILSCLSLFFFFLNGKTKTENYFLNGKLEGLSKVSIELDKTIKELDKNNYIEYIKKPEIKETLIELNDKISFLELKNLTKYNVKINEKNEIIMNFLVNEFENFEKIDLLLKNNNIEYKNLKKNQGYEFIIKIPIDKKQSNKTQKNKGQK